MKKIIILLLLAVNSIFSSQAATPQEMRFHCANDTTKISELLRRGYESGITDANQLVAQYGEWLMGTPYVAHTLEGDKEMLTINIDELDCTTFVETLYALTRTTLSGRYSWRDFAHNLEAIRYRGGNINGYASRLHYISDWIIENTYRGNIKEFTPELDGVQYMVKNIDFMSKNRDKYPALADDATFQKIKGTEIGYRNHRFPYFKVDFNSQKRMKKVVRTGDFVAIVTNIKGLDVQHMGVIVMKDDVPYLLNASSVGKKVQIEEIDLADYIRRNKTAVGVRIIRIVE